MDFDREDHAKNDRWNDGAIDGYRGREPQSEDFDYLDGYREGQREAKVQHVSPARPEGYYHLPLGTFD